MDQNIHYIMFYVNTWDNKGSVQPVGIKYSPQIKMANNIYIKHMLKYIYFGHIHTQYDLKSP